MTTCRQLAVIADRPQILLVVSVARWGGEQQPPTDAADSVGSAFS